MNENFDSFAHKLRMQKFDRNEILKIKTDSIRNQKLKKKRISSVIKIQKVFKGFILRKKFKKIIDEINTKVIIDYFLNRRKERIRKNANFIITRNLNVYIYRKREKKRNILIRYLNYCANIISSFYIGYKLRKIIGPKLMDIKIYKEKLSGLINSFRVRLILRVNKLQEILTEIANIKSCLININADSRNSDKTEQLKSEFNKRLPKAISNFYEEFYKIKKNKSWVNYVKINRYWLEIFLSILMKVTGNKIFKENPNKLDKSLSNSNIDETDDKISKYNRNKLDKRNEITAQIPAENLTENPKYLNKSLNNSNVETYDKNSNIFQKKLEKRIEINQNPVENNHHINRNNSFTNDEDRVYTVVSSEYDNKPIKTNPNKLYEMLNEFSEDLKVSNNENEDNIEEKIIKNKSKNALRKKVPKYDARKAIEEAAKTKKGKEDEITMKSNDRNNFRNFLREIRGDKGDNENINVTNSTHNKNEKTNETNGESNLANILDKKEKTTNDNSKNIMNQVNKNDKMNKSRDESEKSNNDLISNSLKEQDEVSTRRNKVVTINIRKKLHELEKSPPPKVIINLNLYLID